MSDVAVDPVRALAGVLRELPNQLDIEALTSHHFCAGLYVRELFVPADSCIVGKTHATQNFFLLVKGEMTVTTDQGPVRIRAPYMAITQPGTKRAGYAHEDCVCLNIHANPDDAQDLAVLEARYITPEALPAPEKKELLT